MRVLDERKERGRRGTMREMVLMHRRKVFCSVIKIFLQIQFYNLFSSNRNVLFTVISSGV